MRYESSKTARGNIGVSYVSQFEADEQAAKMDATDCTDCTGCTRCTDCRGCTRCTNCTDCTYCKGCKGCTYCTDCTGCTRCTNCTDCTDCKGCKGCTDCTGCTGCTYCTGNVSNMPAATKEQAIKNLDVVAELILTDPKVLYMDHWHETDEWRNRTCAEEAVCGTTHCLAGWLQVCATDPKVRAMEALTAGAFQAPVAAKMFFKTNGEVLDWLRNREYASEAVEIMKNDGGAAFPNEASIAPPGYATNENRPAARGMSMRDYFAAMALQGWLASDDAISELPCDKAYEEFQRDQCAIIWGWADAMLAARSQS